MKWWLTIKINFEISSSSSSQLTHPPNSPRRFWQSFLRCWYRSVISISPFYHFAGEKKDTSRHHLVFFSLSVPLFVSVALFPNAICCQQNHRSFIWSTAFSLNKWMLFCTRSLSIYFSCGSWLYINIQKSKLSVVAKNVRLIFRSACNHINPKYSNWRYFFRICWWKFAYLCRVRPLKQHFRLEMTLYLDSVDFFRLHWIDCLVEIELIQFILMLRWNRPQMNPRTINSNGIN